MTRCASENLFPQDGLGWKAPDQLSCHLESERLIIRSFELDDVPELFKAINDSRDDHLLPWMTWCKKNHFKIEQTTRYVCDQLLSFENLSTFNNVGTGIFCKASGRLVGGSGIHDLRRDTASCETGYWIRKDEIGNGYAREACARTISWALDSQDRGGLGLNRVRLYCSAANIHSRNLIERIGIRLEVQQREDYFVESNGISDRLGWGVLAREWDCEHHRVKPDIKNA